MKDMLRYPNERNDPPSLCKSKFTLGYISRNIWERMNICFFVQFNVFLSAHENIFHHFHNILTFQYSSPVFPEEYEGWSARHRTTPPPPQNMFPIYFHNLPGNTLRFDRFVINATCGVNHHIAVFLVLWSHFIICNQIVCDLELDFITFWIQFLIVLNLISYHLEFDFIHFGLSGSPKPKASHSLLNPFVPVPHQNLNQNSDLNFVSIFESVFVVNLLNIFLRLETLDFDAFYISTTTFS